MMAEGKTGKIQRIKTKLGAVKISNLCLTPCVKGLFLSCNNFRNREFDKRAVLKIIIFV